MTATPTLPSYDAVAAPADLQVLLSRLGYRVCMVIARDDGGTVSRTDREAVTALVSTWPTGEVPATQTKSRSTAQKKARKKPTAKTAKKPAAKTAKKPTKKPTKKPRKPAATRATPRATRATPRRSTR